MPTIHHWPTLGSMWALLPFLAWVLPFPPKDRCKDAAHQEQSCGCDEKTNSLQGPWNLANDCLFYCVCVWEHWGKKRKSIRLYNTVNMYNTEHANISKMTICTYAHNRWWYKCQRGKHHQTMPHNQSQETMLQWSRLTILPCASCPQSSSTSKRRLLPRSGAKSNTSPSSWTSHHGHHQPNS